MSDRDDCDTLDFVKFIDEVSSAKYEQYAGQPSTRIESRDQFTTMRNYVLDRYDGVEVEHSFVDENGQVFDCIPVEQQPSLKGTGEDPGTAPDFSPLPEPKGESLARKVQDQLGPDRFDKYGHAMFCPPGMIPLRRVTLEQLTTFNDLPAFFRKGPKYAPGHKYAYAVDTIPNQGGYSFVNIWNPTVDPDQGSISQQWYVDSADSPVQTVECGWAVWPQVFNNSTLPCLFVYWTADAYHNTGCFNLDCKGFVQTNNTVMLGGALRPWSIYGGAQYEIIMAYHFHPADARWYFALGGLTSDKIVGYYPAALFGSGTLASGAAVVEYGGETIGTTSWPQMGSGHFANEGLTKAAYHRYLYYFPPNSGPQPPPLLTPEQPFPSCYTCVIKYEPAYSDTFLYFGGPGGAKCQ